MELRSGDAATLVLVMLVEGNPRHRETTTASSVHLVGWVDCLRQLNRRCVTKAPTNRFQANGFEFFTPQTLATRFHSGAAVVAVVDQLAVVEAAASSLVEEVLVGGEVHARAGELGDGQ